MTRKLKALGLALVALFAISAVGASGASAHSFMSEGNVGNVTLHGTQETKEVSEFASAVMECGKSTFHGTMATSPATTVTMHYESTECEFGGLEATVETTGCNLVFSGTTNAGNMATVAVSCGTTPIKLRIAGCTIEIAGGTVNQAMNGVSYTNIGSGTTREITVNMTFTSVHYVASGSLCPLLGISPGTHTDGRRSGKVTLTGTVGGVHVGVTIE